MGRCGGPFGRASPTSAPEAHCSDSTPVWEHSGAIYPSAGTGFFRRKEGAAPPTRQAHSAMNPAGWQDRSVSAESVEGSVPGLLGDDPVEDLAFDMFNRGPFADRVVELLDNVASETPSAVLGLMGPWGSGKTSVLQIIRRKLRGHGDWKVVELNPWMVADLPSMIEEFFASLLSALPDGKKGKAIRRKVARYAKAVSPMTSPLRLFGVNAEEALEFLGGVLDGDQSLDARRTELEEALRKHNKPILLIADDLDRLQPDELLLIFKLVRLLGRLPNTYYVLAFDERTALDVLGSTDLARKDPARALAYLEKVVQIRLDLPPAHPGQVGRLLDKLLTAITDKHGVVMAKADNYRLSRAYHEHMASHLQEPRQVKRYCAQLEATYPLVKDEVDFSDFAVVTFLRTFHPGVVPTLVRHKEELTRTTFEWGQKPSHDARLDNWRKRLCKSGVQESELPSLLKLLGELFLPIKGAVDHTEYTGFDDSHRRDRRVDTAEYFDRYFYLGVGESDIEDSKVRAAIEEVLEVDPGPAWAAVVELVQVNSEFVLDKLRRIAPKNPQAAERLAHL